MLKTQKAVRFEFERGCTQLDGEWRQETQRVCNSPETSEA